jgi:hypothetical protein
VFQHDGRRHQVEAAGPVALLLEAAVADFPRRLKNTARASALRASPCSAGMHAAAQLDALQPVQDEQRALDAPSSRRATARPFWRG